ncbi:hypothetical protein H5410_006141 [Solanum commersonii]|uniref:NAC domain-containing protein n=1 Tax=Solanum commersonii TaxID=4109 RepID=A0A9J6A9G8_SOLCO|nr:hypothetical protein H5410_006141 [Solanum commersonii]
MEMNFDDEQLMISLLKFVSGSSVQFQLVDLYGNNKPSQLFDTTTTTATEYHVFTQLKKKKGNGVDNSRPVYDKKKSVIGFKKTFRFEENNHALRLRGHTRHVEEFVVCRITRRVVNSSQNRFQENQDLEQLTTANVIPSDKLNSILNGNMISPVSLVFKESKLPAAIEEECSVPVVNQETPSVSLLPIEEECSVPVVHQETPSIKEVECSVGPDYDIGNYHKELDAYTASVLETMVLYIPQQQEDEADSIPPFYEDFYMAYTDLWS